MEENGKNLSWKHVIWQDVPFWILFIIFWGVILYPILSSIQHRIIGTLGIEDMSGTIWLYWAWKTVIGNMWRQLRLSNFQWSEILFFTKKFFSFPIWFNTGSFFEHIPTYFLEKIFPFPAFFNIKVMLTLLLNCLSFYYLAKYILKDRIIAAACAIMFSASPPILIWTYFGYMEQVYLFPVSLYILYFLKIVHRDEGNSKGFAYTNEVLMGIFLWLSSVLYWYYGVFLTIFSIIYLLYIFLKRLKDKKTPFPLKRVLIGFMVGCILILPFGYPYIQAVCSDEKIDGVHFFISFPAYKDATNPNLGDISHGENIIKDACSINFIWERDNYNYIPPVLFILFIISLFFIRRIPVVWYLLTIFFYILCLGPYIKYRGEAIVPYLRNLTYTFLYRFVPFFSRFHWPSRVQGIFLLFLCILAGYTFLNIKKLMTGFVKYIPVFLFSGAYIYLVFYNHYLPILYTPFQIPKPYQIIKNEKGKIGIIDLPFSDSSIFLENTPGYPNFYTWSETKNNCFWQSIHNKKIFGSLLIMDTYPKETEFNITSHPFFTYLINLSKNPKNLSPLSPEDIKYFEDKGYKYLVVHKRYFKRVVLYNETLKGKNKETLHQEMDKFFDTYMARLKERFGDPISVGYEYLWDGKPWIYSKEGGRFAIPGSSYWSCQMDTPIEYFQLEKYPVYLFRIKGCKVR